jgi:uncharacterized protein (TIGR02001 family)
MTITRTIATTIAAFALLTTSALAADIVRKAPMLAPAPPPPPCDLAFGGGVQSDYNFRGISQTDRGPGGYAYVEPRCKIVPNVELYAGIWAWSVKLPTDPAAEVDLYGGIRPTIGPVTFDFGFMYYWYPRETQLFFATPGLTALSPTNFGFGAFTLANTDFWEFYGKATWTATDWLAIGGFVYYDPNYLNSGAKGTFAGGNVKFTLPSAWFPADWGVYVSGEAAHYWLGSVTAFGLPFFDLPDYTTWNAGFGVTYKVVTFDLRYYDTNLTRAQCFVVGGDPNGVTSGSGTSKWCDATVVAKLSFDMTLNNNIK